MQNLCYFLEKISREIHFVAIYALFCVEKCIQKFSSWRKNDKYEVWGDRNKNQNANKSV